MADTKRQKLIHLHGAGELTDASKLNVGEIAVRHAADAKEATLYITPDQATLIQFPSLPKVNDLVKGASDAAAQALVDAKAYTDEVAGVYASEGVEASGLRKEIAALEVKLQGEVDGVETALGEYKESNDAVVKKIREDFEAADATINATIEANEKTTAAALTDLDSRLKVAEDLLGEGEGSVADQISAAVADVRKDFAAEDTKIRGEFADADDVVRGEFADADDVVRGEFANADDVVRGEFAEADKTLKEQLEAYADQAETDAIAAAKTYTDGVAGAYTAEGVEASGLRKEIEERVAAAGTAAANALDTHAKNTELHVTKDLQDKWNTTTDRVNTFLDSEAIEGTIDTLHEIQKWMETDGKDASDILDAISAEAKLREDGDAATLNSAKAYTDEVAGAYTAEGVEASGLRKEIEEKVAGANAAAAQALTDAKAYTDTRESEVRKDFAAADATTLGSAKAYTDEVAGKYAEGENPATGLRAEIAQASAAAAQALVDAKAYTDTEVKKVADVALESVTVSGADTIVVTPGTNTVDLDFADFTIDCGEY